MNFQKAVLPAGLYFVAVPIGTARDITLRALDILASADILVAEDTRSLRRLMDIHGIPLGGRPLHALHEHTPNAILARLTTSIQNGQSVAYASEAGMPLIADPGYELGRAAAASDLMVTCAPGPSAALTALVVAGLPTDAFFFAGFLPNAKTARCSALAELIDVPGTLVMYESPKRLRALLSDASDILGKDRQAAVCRELTKRFEEVTRGTLEEIAAAYADRSIKGEIVVLIDRRRSEKITESDLESALKEALVSHSTRDAVDVVAKAHGVPRRKVYKLALDLSKG